MTAPLLAIRDLHLRMSSFDGRAHVLNGINLTVNRGEIWGLVGESGCGKSLTGLSVSRLQPTPPAHYSAGEILLEGERWDGLSEAQRRPRRARFQYVPQDAMGALDPQQTALEHVVETLSVLGGRDAEAARAEAVAMLTRLGLGARLDALPREMSGGEQRRVTLARVLALEPRLVVADEPTSGLDPDRRASVLEALVGNLPKDAGCILVTHDMTEAREWCHRVLVMLAGRVIEALELVKAEPVHPYARILFDPWSGPVPRAPLDATGCPFRSNCPIPLASAPDSPCARQVPTLGAVDDEGHRVACHAYPPDPGD